MKVTIVIGVDKDRGYLSNCIRSVEQQTYPDIELLVIRKNQNIAKNFNEGLKQAQGVFIKGVSEDDWLPVDSIANLVGGMGDHPWVVANAINISFMEKQPDICPVEKLNLKDMCEKNVIHGGTVLYRTEIIREIGGMDESLWTAEEYDMHLRLMVAGYYPGYVDKFVYFHRLWKGQKSRIYRQKRSQERLDEIKRIQSLYSDKIQ